MKNKLMKEFSAYDWIVVIGQIRYFIDEYELELLSIDMKKEKGKYIATIKYDLGINR